MDIYMGPVVPADYSPDGDDDGPREPEFPEIDPDAEAEMVDASAFEGDSEAAYLEFEAAETDPGPGGPEQKIMRRPGSWNFSNAGRCSRPRPRGRLSRMERLDSSIEANRCVIAACRRRMALARSYRVRVGALAELAEATVRLRRLEAIRTRIAQGERHGTSD